MLVWIFLSVLLQTCWGRSITLRKPFLWILLLISIILQLINVNNSLSEFRVKTHNKKVWKKIHHYHQMSDFLCTLKSSFRLGKIKKNVDKKSLRHQVFPGGPPSKYYPGPTMLNFRDQTRTGVFIVVWS